jgi:peptidoglycan hydrolase-like protein with peptidoglycan-binding domain
MARSARLPDLDEEVESPLRQVVAVVGGALMRNPALTGGTTAFLVALSFVSANALWYQPHFHEDAFFVTRIVREADTAHASDDQAGRKAGPRIVQTAPRRDPVIAEVQQALLELKFYVGEVDGQSGPATRKAIEEYQASNGLQVTGRIDATLVERLSERDETAAIIEASAPVAERMASAEEVEAAARIRKVQAGLKAFGNDAIEVDGVAGSKTRSAIKEFQTLFGLPVTGEPDKALYAKMREVGLTD